jgi:hypothetical protein
MQHHLKPTIGTIGTIGAVGLALAVDDPPG